MGLLIIWSFEPDSERELYFRFSPSSESKFLLVTTSIDSYGPLRQPSHVVSDRDYVIVNMSSTGELTKLRRRRGVAKGSITRIETRLVTLEGTSDNPTIVTLPDKAKGARC